MAFVFESQAKLYCCQSLNIIKLIIKKCSTLTLDNFGIIGFLFFGRIPVDSSHFSLHFDSILSPKAPKYFILNVLKRSLILDQLAADSFEEECSVLNITVLVEGLPHFSTVLLSLSRSYSTFPLSSGKTLNLN